MGLEHPLIKAFDANDRIKTCYENVDFPAGAYDEEKIDFLKGYIIVQANIPRPKTRYDRIKSLPIVVKTETRQEFDLEGTIVSNLNPLNWFGGPSYQTKTVEEKRLAKKEIFDAFIQLDANFESVAPAQCIRVKSFKPIVDFPLFGDKIDLSGNAFFENDVIDRILWETYAKLLGYNQQNKTVFDMLDNYFKGRLIAEWDDIFYNEMAPVIFKAIVDTIKIDDISTDFTSTIKYTGGNRMVRLNMRGTTSKVRNQFSNTIKIFSDNTNNVKDIGKYIIFIIGDVNISYSTRHYNGVLFNGYVGDDLLDDTDTLLDIPENSDEKRNPRKEDRLIVRKLIEHLNSNLEYYNRVLWLYLDADRRFMLLDGFKIQTNDIFGQPWLFRSLASVVKNELITIVGNSLVMPVAPGYKVDILFVAEQPVNIEGTPEEAKPVDLFEHYKPLTPTPPYRISVPTRGVYAEAVQGACDACEKVKQDTSQDWDKFKTDEPTAINPVTVPVPTVTDWKAAFKDFAAPMVNIQNAPPAPAPGAGLAGLSDLLGKSDVFKDITGLDQNQKNAMQTYLSNQQNAKDFAQMAKEMAMQGHNTEHSDKIADSIRNSPELSKEEKAELLKDHFGQMVDGGQSKKAEQEKAKDNKPTLTDAAIKAADEGKPVKATSADGSGKAESVEIGTGSSNKYRVAGKAVRLVLQGDKDAACWAAAATMMKGWKDGNPYTISQVLAMVGPEYLAKYNNNQALLPSEKTDFVDALGMVGEPPASYPFENYLSWMKSYGPLWITVDSDTSTDIAAHAKILIGYDGDGTEANSRFVFLDPSKEGEQSETFAEFLEEFEQTARDNPGQLFTQVVHFKDAIIGEGNAASTAMINYRPALSSTMVINKIEFETVSNLLNWSDASVEHNRRDFGTRTASQLIHLVLHETSTPVTSESTAHGYDPGRSTTAHMAVLRNATVMQFNDLRQLEYHLFDVSPSSIGIEFVNRDWLASPKGPSHKDPDTPANLYSYDHEAIPAREANLTPQQLTLFPEGNGYLYCFWGMGFGIYRIPPDIAQLEKEVELVQWLTTDLKTKLDGLEHQLNFTPAAERSDLIKGYINAELAVDKVNTIITSWEAGGAGLHKLFFAIERKWLQLVSYDDVSSIWDFPAANVPVLSEQGNKNLFVFTTGWGYLEPANIRGKSGILSHNAAYENHPDGSFLTLYTWLRIEKAFDSTKSYRLAQSLMKDHFFKASLKTNPQNRKIVLLNVEDANLV